MYRMSLYFPHTFLQYVDPKRWEISYQSVLEREGIFVFPASRPRYSNGLWHSWLYSEYFFYILSRIWPRSLHPYYFTELYVIFFYFVWLCICQLLLILSFIVTKVVSSISRSFFLHLFLSTFSLYVLTSHSAIIINTISSCVTFMLPKVYDVLISLCVVSCVLCIVAGPRRLLCLCDHE